MISLKCKGCHACLSEENLLAIERVVLGYAGGSSAEELEMVLGMPGTCTWLVAE